MSSPQFCKVSGAGSSQAVMHSLLVCERETGGPLDSWLPLFICFVFFTAVGSCEYFTEICIAWLLEFQSETP